MLNKYIQTNSLCTYQKGMTGNCNGNNTIFNSNKQNLHICNLIKNENLEISNLDNSAVATGLEKVSFHSNPKERQCQRMFKLLHNCTHLTHQQINDQNSPSEVSTAPEPRNPRCSSQIKKRQKPKVKLPTFIGSQKKQENSRKTSLLLH